MAGLFVGFGAGDRENLEAARVERGGDPLDVASLSGGIPSLVGDDDRDLFPVELVVQAAELLLEPVQFFPVFFLGERFALQRDLGQKGRAVQRLNLQVF